MIRIRPYNSRHNHSREAYSSLDELPQDVLLNALTFLRFTELFQFSLSCQRFFELVHHVVDEYDTVNTNISQWIWKEMCLNEMRYIDKTIRTENIQLSDGNVTFKQQLKSILFQFDVKTCPDAVDLQLSNYNKTITQTSKIDQHNNWKFIRCQKELVPGRCYQWEFVLDHYQRHDSNMWWIILGVETTAKITPSHIGYWMAKEKYQGIGLIVGTGEILYSNASFELADQEIVTFATGDVIGVRFDMTHSSPQNDEIIKKELGSHRSIYASFNSYMRKKEDPVLNVGASLQFFKNGTPMGAPVRCIPGQSFYPAACILNGQQVTVRHWSAQQ